VFFAFCPFAWAPGSEWRLLPNPVSAFYGGPKEFHLLFGEPREQSRTKLLRWFRRKQSERRCRAQGFRLKLCQAMRWKERTPETVSHAIRD
jgi:hypothetical protein